MESSSLREVFGSSISLSELNGDTEGSSQPPAGYSRFGLNEQRPAHQMHARVRRASRPAPRSPQHVATVGPLRRALPRSVCWALLALLALCHGAAANGHLPPGVPAGWLVGALNAVLALLAAYLLPSANTGASASARAPDTVSCVRLYGGLLGLAYLTKQYPQECTLTWAVGAFILALLSKASVPALWRASLLAGAGSLVVRLLTSASGVDLPLLVCGFSAYFVTSLVFGEIGRACERS